MFGLLLYTAATDILHRYKQVIRPVQGLVVNPTGARPSEMSMICAMQPNTILVEFLQWPIRGPELTGNACLFLLVDHNAHGLSHPSSQFYLTFQAAPHLDKKHTVFGKLVGGEEVLDALEATPVKSGTERPSKAVRITEVVMYVLYRRSLLSISTHAVSYVIVSKTPSRNIRLVSRS